ncbi:hypothetical protein ZIOFF_065061 [Zingiber officinale]|uniref:Uncharacterized protein n=1 Tax=Zingiber officinale TaxID=94328 RepID=A0A8J5KGV0_ZINOF|nr:hypothetical protein ZIOFF_065061 [Zingiber officinale]
MMDASQDPQGNAPIDDMDVVIALRKGIRTCTQHPIERFTQRYFSVMETFGGLAIRRRIWKDILSLLVGRFSLVSLLNLMDIYILAILSYHNNAFIASHAVNIANKLNSSTYPLLELYFKF